MVLGFGCKNARATSTPSCDPRQHVITTGCARSPPQSLGEDSHAESKETEILPPEEMDSAPACGFTPHPGDAGGGGTFHQSSIDAADVDRAEQRKVFERANVSAPLPLDRVAANS